MGTATSANPLNFAGNANLQAAGAGTLLSSGRTVSIGTGFTAAIDSQNYSVTAAAVIGGTGVLSKIGGGTLTLSGSNSFGGVTLASAGTLALANSLAMGLSNFDASGAGSLSFGTLAAATFGGLQGTSGTFTIPGSVTLSVGNNNQSTTFAGILAGTGGLVKIGTGTLVISNTQNYSGTTSVDGGTLRLGGGGLVYPAGATVYCNWTFANSQMALEKWGFWGLMLAFWPGAERLGQLRQPRRVRRCRPLSSIPRWCARPWTNLAICFPASRNDGISRSTSPA